MLSICGFEGCGSSNSSKTAQLAFSPQSGPVGTLVTVTGADFSSTQSVSIGGVSAIPVSASSTELVALVMPGATTGSVSVTTSSGSQTPNGNFTVTATGVPSTQQGSKLVATDAAGSAYQGYAVALSADGNTALVGGIDDNNYTGAAWVYKRANGAWTQQGNKLVGTGAVGNALQGVSVALSADGNTALVGGHGDNSGAGAVWVFTQSNGTWTQQGSKLVGSGATGNAIQGTVALSADGNTALIGGYGDNSNVGAAWVFTRSNGTWTQQGSKLVGTGAAGSAGQGYSVALSADGNTALLGGYADNSGVGAAWVFTRSNGTWTQQGSKLVGTGTQGLPDQGYAVALSADGNTALVGGFYDNNGIGAAWVFTRSNGTWTQQGSKLVGTGSVSTPRQGWSLALSADGNTALIGGYFDNSFVGATWVFTRSNGTWTQQGNKLIGSGTTNVAAQGYSVSLSADGNTALIGGYFDNSYAGAAWVFVQ
jgi:IPT/TIG domain/FG-GAP repeat